VVAGALLRARSNNEMQRTSRRPNGGSPLISVLAGLQAAHPGSLAAGTKTDSTGRDRHEMATVGRDQDDVRQSQGRLLSAHSGVSRRLP
jgi:hypothetical protein